MKTVIRLGPTTTDLVEEITRRRFLMLREVAAGGASGRGGAVPTDALESEDLRADRLRLDAIGRIVGRPGSHGR